MKPSLFMLATEPARAIVESLSLTVLYSVLQKYSYAGSGVVVTVPGFTATDHSMYFMRKFLSDMGYNCYGWGQGQNTQISEERISIFADHILSLSRTTNEPVNLIGHSLGGVYAREVAKLVPEAVKGVITLGSPFNSPEDATCDAAFALYQKLNTSHKTKAAILENLKVPPKCQTVSVYSMYDGVVHWSACKQEGKYPNVINISTTVGHVGMVHSPLILHAITKMLKGVN